jgi:hypothetical protein
MEIRKIQGEKENSRECDITEARRVEILGGSG